MLRSSGIVARTWGWCAMSDELKPCPFCGGEARAFRCEESGTFDVQCQRCGAIPFIGSRTSEKKTMADVIAAWNARTAVTDEQFAMAVHDGEAWQKVRTCQMVDLENVRWDDYAPVANGARRCSSCGKLFIRNGDVPRPNYCPNCGAKVIPC